MALLLAFRPVLRAQDSATLTVTVVDQSAAMVPGAALTLRDTLHGTVKEATTPEDGHATFGSLQPSEYSLVVLKSGFNEYHIDRLILNVRDRQTLRVELKVSPAAGTSVEVNDRAEAMSSDAGQGISLDQQYIQNLPANGRNAESLILMTPGITSAAGGKADGGFNANGLRSNTNYFTLDGVSLNQSIGGGGGPGGGRGGFGGGGALPGAVGGSATEMITIDAMQEMKVQTSSFAPEFGRTPGAQIAMTSRGGTNSFHGSLFYYWRSDAYDANDWFADQSGRPKGKERQNRPGGTFGGPIIKNKTFFFVSFEKLKLLSPYTLLATVPDMASRQAAPAALRPFLNAFPIPNGRSLGNNGAQYEAVLSNPSNSSSSSARIDHILSASTTLFARYSVSPSNGDRRASDFISPSLVTIQSARAYTATAGATHLFEGGAIDDLKLNYSRSQTGTHSITDNYGGAVPLTDAQVFPKGITSANGSFNLNIMGFAGYSYGGDTSGNQQQINVVDSLTKVSGNHHYKIGLDYRLVRQTSYRKYYSVSVSFNGISGNNYSFLTGYALNAMVSSNVNATYPQYMNFSMYGQDTWRATDRTTITYGLRWDVNPAPTAWKGPLPFALSSSSIAGVTQNQPIYATRWYDVAPRFGVAYLSDDKPGREMTLRAGIGMFYDMGYGIVAGAFSGAPYANVETNSEVQFPLSAANLAPPVLPPTRPYGQVTTGATGLVSPVVYEWNGTWEKYFGPGQMLSVGITGTRGKNLMRTETQPSFSDAYQVLRLATNGASSEYNGVQVQFRKRVSASLQTQLSYTWSHSIDSSSTDSGFGGGFASLYGSGERGSSDYDIRHNVNLSGSWRLPAPRNGLLFSPLRGWYLDFVAAGRTGLPFDLQGVSNSTSGSTSTTATNGLFASVRPDWDGLPIWIADPHAPGGQRLNPAAFFIPTGYTQGNMGRNALRGFSFAQLDLSVRRVIRIAERCQMSIAVQGYNVLNHPNFANPSPMEGANMASPDFGVATRMMNQSFGGGVNSLYRSGGARSMELVLRFQF
jgi:hypothetical protein